MANGLRRAWRSVSEGCDMVLAEQDTGLFYVMEDDVLAKALRSLLTPLARRPQ